MFVTYSYVFGINVDILSFSFQCSLKLSMERVMGIEPTTSAWKAEVLPLNYTRLFKLRILMRPRGLEPPRDFSH